MDGTAPGFSAPPNLGTAGSSGFDASGLGGSGFGGDNFSSAFPPAAGGGFGGATDYNFPTSVPGDMAGSGFGAPPPDFGALGSSGMTAPDFAGAMSGTFPTAASASVGGAFPADVAGDMLAGAAPSLQDLEKSKDHLVNAATAAAAGAVASVMGTSTQESGGVFQVTVTDPVKQGDGMRSYISYKINTKTTLPQYQWKEFSVIHRYSDFVWLQEMLKAKYEHVIIPPLPEKAVTGNFEPTFIQLRRAALEKFLQRVVGHPILQTSEDLQIFLEAQDEVLKAAKSQASKKTEVKAGKKGGIMQFFREAAQSVSNTVSKMPEEFHDPTYEEQKAKIAELKNQVENLQRFTMRLVYRQRELSVIMTELGVACQAYAEIEQDRLANAFRRVGDANDKIGMMTGEHASVVEQEFDAMLQENVLMLSSVGDLFANRQSAIVALQTARGSHQGKVQQYERIKGNPSKTGRAHEISREIAEADEEEKTALKQYDLVKMSTATELERFQMERVQDFKNMLMNYARTNANYHQGISDRWSELLKELEAEFSSM